MLMTQTSLYLGSKGAVEQFVRVLAREIGDRGFTVNAVPRVTPTQNYFRNVIAQSPRLHRLSIASVSRTMSPRCLRFSPQNRAGGSRDRTLRQAAASSDLCVLRYRAFPFEHAAYLQGRARQTEHLGPGR